MTILITLNECSRILNWGFSRDHTVFQLKFRKRCKLFRAVPFLSDTNMHIAHGAHDRFVHNNTKTEWERERERERDIDRERSLYWTVNLSRRLISMSC